MDLKPDIMGYVHTINPLIPSSLNIVSVPTNLIEEPIQHYSIRSKQLDKDWTDFKLDMEQLTNW